MDFLKKHYEKVTLAAALLVLIVSAAFLALRVSALSDEVSGAQMRLKPKVKTVEPIDTGAYTNAIASLASPVLWQQRPDMFGTAGRVVETGPKPLPPPPGAPVAVERILRQPFKLIFRSYTGRGENFQVDFLTGGRSFFVRQVGDKVADRFGDTGYVTTKFDYKTVLVYNPALGVTNEVDISELTIQYPGDDPIVMPLNKVVEEREPVTDIVCAESLRQHKGVRRGQAIECDGVIYNVVDITSTQVIIENRLTKEKWQIRPAVGR